MSEAKSPDEIGLDAALEVLESPLAELEARLAAGDDATAALRRQHVEAFAQLAWALPAAPASAAGRERLLAALQGDETVRVARPVLLAGPGGPAPGPLGVLDPPAPPAPAAGSRLGAAARAGAGASGAGAAGGGRRPTAPVVPFAAPQRSYGWALPLAAVFALATIGVGLHDWRLSRQLGETRLQLAAVRHESEQLAAKLQSPGGDAVPAMAAKMRDMQSQLALVTSSGSLVCALRPSPGTPARGAAGVLYVADDHQHWYLRAQNLPPPGEGRAYRLWFLVGDAPVHAGAFTMEGSEAVMSSPTMPKGTSAALITIEPAGEPGARPSGPVVLYGRDIKPLV
ncbi:MAG TPA: anti-sigma factor [Thermoanaerobaculia bacterium]|jgi:hypothetical protein|nr:anti-sigma factor [Thermoanaerobaculia bacterium]